ncbi:MarR family transcriptional regulator [Streptomyces pseudogriseolus]|uniref:MarR family winged helix-turn-helix transcriptional regulator n=1 Tax=Streptomyces pseudogriseolus TaxID=36817 RepID=UPI00348A168E|nr:MarR family transcriptional regulator [Streptomyces pseudogriseolus]
MSDDPAMIERWIAMAAVHRRIEARIEQDLRRQVGLGSREFCALSVLRRGTRTDKGPLHLGELAVAVGLSPSATSRLVARLEVQDLITLHTSPVDRRSVEIELTGAAHATVLAGTSVLHRAVTDAVRQLDAEGAVDTYLLRYLHGEPHDTGTSR